MAAQTVESRPAKVNRNDLASGWLQVSPENILVGDYRPAFKDYDPQATHLRPVGHQRVFGTQYTVDATTPQGWVLLQLGVPNSRLRGYANVHVPTDEQLRISSATQRNMDIYVAGRLEIPAAQSVLARIVGNKHGRWPREFAAALTRPQDLIGPAALRLMAFGKVIDAMVPNDWYHLVTEGQRRAKELEARFPNPEDRYYQRNWRNGGDKNLAHEALATAAQYAFSSALESISFRADVTGSYPRRLVTMATVVAADEIVYPGTWTHGSETIGISLFTAPDGKVLDKATLRALRTVKPETVAKRYKARNPY